MLIIVLLSMGLLCASAVASALAARHDQAALEIGTLGSVLSCVVGACAALLAVVRHEQGAIRLAWSMPLGEFHVGLDALSSFFLVCIFGVAGLSAIYGRGYFQSYSGKRRLAPAVFFSNVLVAAMVMLVVARDGILFLIAWEVMSLASFFLVTWEHDREDVRRAGMTYLVASHLGVVFLFVLFALLGRGVNSYDFDVFVAAGAPTAASANLCFLLALVGFGAKAGFWPVHIWLPEAHPAAPSPVSALMSGVMIKMGIYGLMRSLTFLGPPPAFWGTILVVIGAVSGVLGVLLALAQQDIKRLLAYSSVENIGIMTLGIGLGLLGQSHGNPTVAFLGYAGALLHVLNHGLFKGLLFMGAGSVLHATATRHVDSLGALGRRMPTTASAFLVGSMAISGLPPFNGFVSEWLIYVGAFNGAANLPTIWAVSALVVIPALALVGGLAAACFVRAFGVVFLGEPRTEAAAQAHEVGWAMRASMIVGALLCIAIGIWPTAAVRLVAPAAGFLGKVSPIPVDAAGPLLAITRTAAVLLALIVLIAALRFALLRGRQVTQSVTWGCGYTSPTPRMQYTASSFADPLIEPFASATHVRTHQEGPTGFFPVAAHYDKNLGDIASEKILMPAMKWLVGALARLRFLQQGRLQLYLVYIAATLVMLLVWQLIGVGG